MNAADRLAQSRAQLRAALRDARPADAVNGSSASTGWFDEVRANPGINLAAGVIEHWWSRHPLRASASLAARATRATVEPIAERHPLGLLAGAFVVGGLVAWSRPWRWSKTPVWSGLLPQLLLATLKAAPPRRERPPAAPAGAPPPAH